MPRYSISNVPTKVKKYPPDPGEIGGDWGIYGVLYGRVREMRGT